jgi:hypothetical protein
MGNVSSNESIGKRKRRKSKRKIEERFAMLLLAEAARE